jgi:hypothetical protein
MGTSDLFTSRFKKKIKILHFSVSKNYNVKYIKRYIQKEHTQKNLVKNTLYFRKYKKTKF